jgi:hypothetical protein
MWVKRSVLPALLWSVWIALVPAAAPARAAEEQLEPAYNQAVATLNLRLAEMDRVVVRIGGQVTAAGDAGSAQNLLRPVAGVRVRAGRQMATIRWASSAVQRAASALARQLQATPPVTSDARAAVAHGLASALQAARSATAIRGSVTAIRSGQWSLAARLARQADTARARLRVRQQWAQQRFLMVRGGLLHPWLYGMSGYQLRQLPPAERPYARSRPIDLGRYDGPLAADGTVRFEHNGKLYDHPLSLARYAIQLLESYRLNRDRRYLERARANLERLVNVTTVRARNAEYYAYPFDYQVSPDPNEVLRAPWYSAIAQGRAVSALLRMYEATGEVKWREHADRAFASFLNDRWPRKPWVSFVQDGYLWLEQYPIDIAPSRVLNGHIWAAIGIYEYALATGSQQASALFDAAATTIRRNFHRYRVPGQLSLYDLRHNRTFLSYHETHIRQMRLLATITGDSVFNQFAALLQRDQRTAGPETG